MIGIYITARGPAGVTGHYIHTARGVARPTVQTFTNCSLEFVLSEAARVIHEPTCFDCIQATTTKTLHTPGPWTENSCEIQAVDGSPICEMLARPEDSGVNYPHRPIADANSRLICAAPALLAACLSGDPVELKAAIAKAV